MRGRHFLGRNFVQPAYAPATLTEVLHRRLRAERLAATENSRPCRGESERPLQTFYLHPKEPTRPDSRRLLEYALSQSSLLARKLVDALPHVISHLAAAHLPEGRGSRKPTNTPQETAALVVWLSSPRAHIIVLRMVDSPRSSNHGASLPLPNPFTGFLYPSVPGMFVWGKEGGCRLSAGRRAKRIPSISTLTPSRSADGTCIGRVHISRQWHIVLSPLTNLALLKISGVGKSFLTTQRNPC